MKSMFTVTLTLLALVCSVLIMPAPGWSADKQTVPILQVNKTQSMQTSKNPDIQAVKPKKPAKIKLHRSTSGQYSWDITGDSADEVYRADSRLRKLLRLEDKND
jgi:hypothetical protein